MSSSRQVSAHAGSDFGRTRRDRQAQRGGKGGGEGEGESRGCLGDGVSFDGRGSIDSRGSYDGRGGRAGDRCGSSPRVTEDGAAWLVSAGTYPRSMLARWTRHPAVPLVLPCGITFDVVSAPAVFGRRMLDQLRGDGPGSGPVAVQRGRVLLFAAPGTAQRLPSLLRWEEWGAQDGGRGDAVPALLCLGGGDAVTVPPLVSGAAGATTQAVQARGEQVPAPRWLVAPDVLRPWLPGPEVLLWACVRAVRRAGSGGAP